MCISFFYLNQNCEANEFRFILIFNKDDNYARKITSAHFWTHYPTILGGSDIHNEIEGNWLGVKKNGRIGVVLNSLEQPSIDIPDQRKALVTDYLCRSINAIDYIQELRTYSYIPQGFNLLLFDLMSPRFPGYLYTLSNNGKTSETIALSDGIYGISNSPMNQSFKKVICGKEKFKNVIKNFNHVDKKDTLVEELLSILKSEIKYFPDPTLSEITCNFLNDTQKTELSSTYVHIPEANYGTRSHTVLLVTYDMMGYFYEYFKVQQENSKSGNSQWIHNQFVINFDQPDGSSLFTPFGYRV